MHSHCSTDHSHSHSHSPSVTTKGVWIAMTIIVVFAGVEWGMGNWSHSLALQADASHLLSDSGGLLLVAIAGMMAMRWTAFSQRIEAISGLVNGGLLLILASYLLWQGVDRLLTPPAEILSFPMIITACIGLAVNSINVTLLHGESHHNLNIRGAFLHSLADLFTSIGVLITGLLIALFHYLWLDGIISILVAGLIVVTTLPLLKESMVLIINNRTV